jgi:hypothetical protein
MVLSGKVEIASMIERFPLEQVNEVVKRAHEGRLTHRAVLVPDLGAGPREGEVR